MLLPLFWDMGGLFSGERFQLSANLSVFYRPFLIRGTPSGKGVKTFTTEDTGEHRVNLSNFNPHGQPRRVKFHDMVYILFRHILYIF